MPKYNSGRKKSPLFVMEIVIMCILAVLIAAMLILYFSFREPGAVPKFFGYHVYRTQAVNMEPKVPAGAAVFASEKEKDSIVPGSVVLCKIDNTPTIINVVEQLDEEGGSFYIVRFNTAAANDTYKIPAESVIAKAVYYDKFTGSLLAFATSERGIIVAVIIPSILIVLFQVIKIVLAQKNEYDDEDDEDYGEEQLLYGGNELRGGEPFRELPPVRAKFDTAAPKKPESVVRIDSRGAAVYEPVPKKQQSVLITEESLDLMSGKTPEQEISALYRNGGYVNEPVKIYPEKKPADPISDILGDDLAQRTQSAFKTTDVLPETITSVKTSARPHEEPAPVKSRRFTPTPRSMADDLTQRPEKFFDPANIPAPIPPDENDRPILTTKAIPENSVDRGEKIAPKRKASPNPTVDELMSIINAEQAKIKKNKH